MQIKKELISEKKKEYQKKNRETLKEYLKQYRETNKEKIAEQRKKKYNETKQTQQIT